ncbi:MAG: ACP S-malonyltransferase [Bacteroidales bacterium]|nr:ACP S-malonyltransferase [Bacteroidales bacterium]
MKTAYVFPGQGSQFPGMGKDLYDSNPEARSLMDKADGILGFSLTDIMFNGSDDDLRRTDVTQPAIFLHSVVLALCSGLDEPLDREIFEKTQALTLEDVKAVQEQWSRAAPTATASSETSRTSTRTI